jgi:hypothetical protein
MNKYVNLQATGKFAEPASAQGLPCPTHFYYSSIEPLAVTVTFGSPSGERQWLIGRDLLWEALSRAAGVPGGDVEAWAGGDQRFFIRVSSPDGAAIVHFSVHEIRTFLQRTFLAVPPGTEYPEDVIDNELALYFSEG